MTQQVNLYLPEFRKKEDWLNFTALLQLSATFVVVLCLISVFQYFQAWRLEGKLEAAEARRDAANADVTSLIDRLGSNAPDQTLVSNLARLEEELEEKNLLLGFMENSDLGNTQGFSEYLADLSRYHIDGLQITDLNLSRSGNAVSIGGQVEKADLVPLYLRNLSRGQVYQGKSFETLQIDQKEERNIAGDQTGILNFNVSTTGE